MLSGLGDCFHLCCWTAISCRVVHALIEIDRAIAASDAPTQLEGSPEGQPAAYADHREMAGAGKEGPQLLRKGTRSCRAGRPAHRPLVDPPRSRVRAPLVHGG